MSRLTKTEKELLARDWGVSDIPEGGEGGEVCTLDETQILITHGRVDVLLTLESLGAHIYQFDVLDDMQDLTGLAGREGGTTLMLNDDVHLLLAFWQMLFHGWTPLECIDASDCDRVHILSGAAHFGYGTRSGRCKRPSEQSPPGVCAVHEPTEHMRAFIGLALEMAADSALPSGEEFELQERTSRLRSEWVQFADLVRSRRVGAEDVARFCDTVLEPNIVAWRRANDQSARIWGAEERHCAWKSRTQAETWIESAVRGAVMRACQTGFNVCMVKSRPGWFY